MTMTLATASLGAGRLGIGTLIPAALPMSVTTTKISAPVNAAELSPAPGWTSSAAPVPGCPSSAGAVSGYDSLAERLNAEAQALRLSSLENSFEATRVRHGEEVSDLEAQITALRTETADLRASLQKRDKQLASAETRNVELKSAAAAREDVIVERTREVAQLKALLESQGSESQRLQEHLSMLVGQLRQSDQQASDAKLDKERSLLPTQVQNAEMGRNLATKQRQLAILQQEVETSGCAFHEARAHASRQQERAIQVQSAQGAELAFRENRIKHLEAQIESQAAQHRQKEQQLNDRCRLLKAWCFRTWWSLEAAGSSGFPGLASEESMPFESMGRHVRVSSSANRPGSESLVPVKAPIPGDWRSVLRFQASLFHWLAVETVRGKVAHLQGSTHELELPLPQKEDEQKKRDRSASRRRKSSGIR